MIGAFIPLSGSPLSLSNNGLLAGFGRSVRCGAAVGPGPCVVAPPARVAPIPVWRRNVDRIGYVSRMSFFEESS